MLRILVLAGVLGILGGAAQVRAATLELTGPAGIAVTVDGRQLGSLPLDGPINLPLGNHTITARAQGYMPFVQTVNLASDQANVRLFVRLTRYSRKTALTSNLLVAGLGQFYLGQKIRGWVYLLAEAGGLVTALSAELQRSDYSNDVLRLQERYNTAYIPEEITAARLAADQAYQDMQDMEDLRNTGLLIAGGAVILSMLDALILFPSAVDLGPGPVAPVEYGLNGASSTGVADLSSIHAGIRLAF